MNYKKCSEFDLPVYWMSKEPDDKRSKHDLRTHWAVVRYKNNYYLAE